ncbi:833_t:CDS:2, partial [Paraglomus occultum]
ECGSARKIEDLNAVTYPPHIKPPDPTLNQDAQPGKYKYQRSFLMQFMTVCKKKPENLSHLDAIGHQQVGGLTIPMEMVAPLGRSDNRLVSQSVPGEVPKAGDHIIELANKSKEECSGRILKTIIQLTFEKACDEPNYSQIYAQLCRKMLERIDMDIFDETIKNAQGECVRGAALFRKYLLTMCQESFEKGWKIPNNEKGMPNRFSDKRRGLGLIRFIGELFKVHMLTERIMHDCIKKLLANREDPEEEEAEFLCELLMIIGKELDYLRAKSQMNAYFIRMDSMSKNTKLSSRIRFMLTDVIELRKRNWIPRHDNDTNAPRTIGDIQPRSGIWGSSSRFGQASGNSTRLSRTSDDRDKVGMQHGMQQMSDWTVGPSSARKVDLTRFGQVRSNKVNLALGNDPIARLASGSEGWRTIKEHNEKGSSMSSTHTYNVLSGYTLKSSSISQEEAKRKIKAMVDEYWSVRDKKEVAVCIKELPDRYFGDAIREFIESALDKKPADVSNCADLLKELRKQDAISPADCKKAFTIIMGNLGDIAVDVPHAYAHTGQLLHGAQLELREVITLVGLLTGIGGSEPPSAKVVAAYLNSIKTSMGELMVLRKVKNANFDFALLFPDGNKDAVNRFLEKQ